MSPKTMPRAAIGATIEPRFTSASIEKLCFEAREAETLSQGESTLVATMQSFPFGPSALGRGAVLSPGQSPPPFLAGANAFKVDAAVVADPSPLVDALHRHWIKRESVVITLEVDAGALRAQAHAIDTRPPWQVGVSFLFDHQRLHFLIWNNNVDLRSGEPIWWWGRKALALGAIPSGDESADVVLPDGRPAYCDGGPLMPLDVEGAVVVPYVSVESGNLRPLSNRAPSAQLADDQLQAVSHRGGAARVIAPAGSGKTRVLTERLRHTLANWNVDPAQVCAVAYNTRAARELSERTEGLPTHIRTLNSLALAIVNGTGGFRSSSLESRQRTIVEEREVRNILQSMVKLPRRVNTDPLAPWVEALSTTRLGLLDPRVVEEQSGDLDDFAQVFDRYRTSLRDRGLLDFDEQIYRAIEILLGDSDARVAAQRRCRMLLVDELQDLTPAHLLMLRLLASPALDVFGVGDDDQVIYGYAGADPRFLVDVDTWFPGAARYALEVNYRCKPRVVHAASNLLTRNAVRVDKTIRPRDGVDDSPDDLELMAAPQEEMTTQVRILLEKWRADGCSYNEMAILSRVNVTLLPIQLLLATANIPHSTPLDRNLLERTGIRTALAYLRMALHPDQLSRTDILETVRRPSRKIARNVVEMMTKRQLTSLSDLRRLASALSGDDGPRLRDFIDDVELVADATEKDATTAIDAIRDKVGLGDAMDVLDRSRKDADRSTHADDLAALTAAAQLHTDASTFESWLRRLLAEDRNEQGVELSTIHRVKGREWSRVVVYDASAGLFPHRLSTDRAEERRVFHVALTRGRDRVVVLSNADAPSRFIEELSHPGEPEATSRLLTQKAVASSRAPTKRAGIAASIGLSVAIPGGVEGEIVELAFDNAVVASGKARLNVPFGSMVRVGGKLVELQAPLDEATVHLVDALKDWRRNVASENKVPAYTVLHDTHLEAIAQASPTSLDALARCNGIGPTKLERWGDEILAVVESCGPR